jgi:hypothetical protein
MATDKPLPPMPQPLGVFDSFIAKQTETIVLQENVLSLSGDSFSIKLKNGPPILQVRGSVMSISGRKSMCDMAGNHFFDIQKELLHIHATYAGVTPEGQKILEVKSKFSRELLSLPFLLTSTRSPFPFHPASFHSHLHFFPLPLTILSTEL